MNPTLPCTLKLRHTGSDTKGGGIGPMVTENLSCTLSTLQDQTLITAGGGYDNAIGFLQKQSAAARSLGEGHASPTLSQDSNHICVCYDGYNQRAHKEVCMTLRSAMTGNDGNDADPKIAYGINPVASGAMLDAHPIKEASMTLRKSPGGENGVVSIGFKTGQSANGGLGDEREVAPTLSHTPNLIEPTVCCNGPQAHSTTRGYGVEVAPTMGAAAGDSGNNKPFVAISALLSQMCYIVRRLTPVECMRLMGLPDGYTIPTGLRRFFGADGEPSPELVAEFQRIFDTYNAIMAEYAHKKPPKPKSAKQVAEWLKKVSDPATCPDSPQYKAAGNGWATNQPRWILTRLLAKEGIDW